MKYIRPLSLVVGVVLFALCCIATAVLLLGLLVTGFADVAANVIGGLPFIVGGVVGAGLIAFGSNRAEKGNTSEND